MKKRGTRVLVVEDNAIDQLVIASALRRVGYTPEIAPTIDEAMAAIARHSADIVFVDVATAGDEGYARAAQLRRACDAASSGTATRTPIVALVGRVRDEERAQCLAAGIDDLLGKPVDLEALVATVGRWVETRGSSAPAAESVEEVPATKATRPDWLESTAPVPNVEFVADPAIEIVMESVVGEPLAEVEVEPFADIAVEPFVEIVAEPIADVAAEPETEIAPEPVLDAIAVLPVFDAACLETASMGNAEIRGLLIDAFLTRTRQPLDRLKKAAEWKDVRALEFQAHAMRGMCQSVGAVRCAAALGQVEDEAAAGRLDEALVALGRIDDELAAVRAQWSGTTTVAGEDVARAA
jgi:CheY-like chemotaxis protein/HPt (histidine-containing phosphotransfer) domain-containing protein